MLPKKIGLITFLQNKGNLNTIHMPQDKIKAALFYTKMELYVFILHRPGNIDLKQFNLNNFVEEKMYVKPPNDLQLANG